jgi:hypothetical protein
VPINLLPKLITGRHGNCDAKVNIMRYGEVTMFPNLYSGSALPICQINLQPVLYYMIEVVHQKYIFLVVQGNRSEKLHPYSLFLSSQIINLFVLIFGKLWMSTALDGDIYVPSRLIWGTVSPMPIAYQRKI